jgi:hypothetical protein
VETAFSCRVRMTVALKDIVSGFQRMVDGDLLGKLVVTM